MPAATVHLTIEQGATWRQRLVWKSDGQPVDLTGWTARMQARNGPGSKVLFDVSTENGGVALGADGGIDLLLDDEATAALQFRDAVFDLFLRSPDGTRSKVVKGTVSLDAAVTR